MFTSTSSSQDQLRSLQNRRLLLHSSPPYHSPPTVNQTAINQQEPMVPYTTPASNGFDANVMMVLSVLLCALFCSLGLNSIIRCALRCSTMVASSDSDATNQSTASARLANTGINRKDLKRFPTVSYSAEMKLPGLDTDCAICLSEFAPGERVRLLPQCNHGFHVRCIDKWLNSHSSCPTCRHCLIQTHQKIAGCNEASSSQPPPVLPLPQEAIMNVAPLEREDMIHNYRGSNS